jgi:hypothetical protein
VEPGPSEERYSVEDLDTLLVDPWHRVHLSCDLRPIFPEPVPLYRFWTERPIGSARSLVWTMSCPKPGGGVWTEVFPGHLSNEANRGWLRFVGWRLNLFGLLVAWSSDDDPPWPAVRYTRTDESGEVLARRTLQVWRGRSWRGDAPVYAELSWTPERGRVWQTGGYGNPPSRAELAQAKLALNLLDLSITPAGGRPPESDEQALDEAVGWAREWLRRHPDATPAEIGRPELQEVSGMSHSGLNKRMAEKRITLKKIRARLQKEF